MLDFLSYLSNSSLRISFLNCGQYKFDDLIAALAGNENSAFFVMSSALGTGFYILIGYSVLAGILQYIFNSAVSEYYHVDPFHKIDYWWTPMLRCFLRDEK